MEETSKKQETKLCNGCMIVELLGAQIKDPDATVSSLNFKKVAVSDCSHLRHKRVPELKKDVWESAVSQA